jgi:alpha-L-fucosidase
LLFFEIALVLLVGEPASRAQSVEPFGPLPSGRQQVWQDREFYLFAHFGPNTFTDLEWGKGTEKEEVFNPTSLDCRQWCRIAKAAGAKGIIITAKHHDGFCLWPSEYSQHTVAQSKWKGGKGDVLKELSDACKEYGLELGVYLSPWDRNHPKYGTPGYNEVFMNMMKEVVARYGPLFEFWWDGANGEGPNGKKQVYDFGAFEKLMRRIAPGTPVFSDIGPDIRWVGNERGIAGKTNWDLLDTAGFKRGAGGPPVDTLNTGNVNGKLWLPAECDVSIRPGWFYHPEEDQRVKTPGELFQLYLKSVGRGANLLLNVPPDRRGMFTQYDSAALMGFKKLRDESFAHSLVKEKGVTATVSFRSVDEFYVVDSLNARRILDGDAGTFVSLDGYFNSEYIEIRFPKPTDLNCIVLQEPINMGQRVRRFAIELVDENRQLIPGRIEGSTIGRKRILSFPRQRVAAIQIHILDAKAQPLLSEVNAYLIDEKLIETN